MNMLQVEYINLSRIETSVIFEFEYILPAVTPQSSSSHCFQNQNDSSSSM